MKNLESFNITDDIATHEKITEDDLKTFEDLKIIAQRVGGDFGMEVKIGKKGEGSFFDPERISISIDPLHLQEKPEVTKFVIAHEGGHRAITRSPRRLGLSDKKVNELYGQTGFGYIQNAIEDPADNDWVRKKFPGLDEYVKINYDTQFIEENAVLSSPEVARIAQQLGYWPKFARFGSEVIRNWHQGRFSNGVNPDVEVALQKTLPAIKQSIASIPGTDNHKEQEIIKFAQRRFKINTEEVWPIVKTLVEKDIDDANKRQIAQKVYDKIKESKKNQTESLKKEIADLGFSDEQQKELEDAIDAAIESLTNGVGEGKPDETAKNFGNPVPMDKLSENIKSKLKELFDKLDKKAQEQIMQESKKELDALEEKLNESLEGGLVKDKVKPSKPKDGNDADGKLSQGRDRSYPDAANKSEESEKIRDSVLKKFESLREKTMNEYEKTRSDVSGQINNLYSRLMYILRPEERGEQETGYPSGQMLDIARAMQGDQDATLKQKMWVRESLPQRKDYRFWHLVDMSGSMNGSPIEEAYKGFIVAAEAIDKVENFNNDQVKVQQGIAGFDDSYYTYKDFKQRFNGEIEKKLSGMKTDGGGGTNTYLGTKNGLESLAQNAGTTGNFLLTFTDGAPNYDVREKLQKLLKTGKEERKKKNIKVGLVWIGNENDSALQRMIKEYGYDFGLCMPAVGAEKDFSEMLGNLLEDILQNQEKY